MKLRINNKIRNLGSIQYAALFKGFFSFGLLTLLFFACKKDETETVRVPLTMTDYYPNSGNQGTLVTVEGTGFTNDVNAVSATFSGTKADVVSATATAIVLRAPSGGTSGDIAMKVNDESLAVGKYTYQDLTIREISPAKGSAGAHIRISGAGFGSLAGPAEVYINGNKAIVVSASDTLLVAEVPVDAGSGPVVVKVNGKEAAGQTFKYQSITAIKPLTGGKGTRVRITGSGFDTDLAGNLVDFNGKQAMVEEAADEYLIVIAPDGVATGPLSVTTNNQKLTGPVFTVVALPLIFNVTPLSGPAGTEMVITGSTFSTVPDENVVTINGKVAPVLTASDIEITLAIPGGTGSGKILLRVNDQLAEGPNFKDQNLGISKVSPENGLAGTSVTITGTGFNEVAAQNRVTFNGTVARVISATTTSITVIAPEGFTSGPLKITVNGVDAFAPADFNRAGVVTLAGGPNSSDLDILERTGAITVDRNGNVYVLEQDRNRVKRITAQGVISIFAGSATGESGNRNGTGTEALFSLTLASALAVDNQNNIYVSDFGNQSIRKITPQGVVSNYSTNLGKVSKMDFDEQGILYVNSGFSSAWKIDKTGSRTSIRASAMDENVRPAIYDGKLYNVSNESIFISYQNISGEDSGLNMWVGGNYGYEDGIKTAASFTAINCITSDGKGLIYAADMGNLAIRKIEISTGTVTTSAKFTKGFKDGSLIDAQFGSIGDIAVDKDGNLYVLDYVNKAVRKIILR